MQYQCCTFHLFKIENTNEIHGKLLQIEKNTNIKAHMHLPFEKLHHSVFCCHIRFSDPHLWQKESSEISKDNIYIQIRESELNNICIQIRESELDNICNMYIQIRESELDNIYIQIK